MVYKWLKYGQYVLLPGTCVVCGQLTCRHRDLCPLCELALPVLERPCRRCGLPLPPGYADQLPCGACLTQPPPYTALLAPFRYDDPVSMLISAFKYQGRLVNGSVLVEFLLARIRHDYRHQPLPDLILPMPLHKSRLRQRGFNQAVELGKVLSRRLGIPQDSRVCLRSKATPGQMGLNARQRRQNIRGAFCAVPYTDLSGFATVAVVDDVVTTGATAAEFSRLLLTLGANNVHIWTLARTCL